MTNFQQRHPDGAGPNDKRIRVLIVDDSAYILELLISFFTEHPGFDLVGTAVDGFQAMRRVATLEPDLVLMDVQLPGMSGLEATRRIKASRRESVIIIMTTNDDQGGRAAARAAGADGFVGKAGEMLAELQSVIRAAFPGARL